MTPASAMRWLRARLQPADSSDLSAGGHARLLDMSYNRLRFSVYMMPLVSLPLIAYHARHSGAQWIALWGLCYSVLSLWVWRQHRRYRRDQAERPASDNLHRWRPRVQRLALAHGAGLSACVLATQNPNTQASSMLLYLVMGHLTAANATHQTPTIGVFLRFFASGWNVMLLLTYWVFPMEWPFYMSLSLIYSLVVYRHALISHRFSIEQVRLEEHSQQLADRFRAARDQAEAALQEKNLFLTTASHDLRQPLHAMSLLVEAVAQRNHDPKVAPLLRDLKLGMGSMNLMFNSLLDLSKLEAGAMAQRRARVALQPLVDDTVTLFREQASQRGLVLRQHVPAYPAVAWGDPALLRQALVNLVHNALRYTERGGILIGLRPRGTDWQIEVWDSGAGIAAEDGEQIFSPYYRHPHAWRIDSAGHGLGLSVVARCARLMEASLGFQSRLGRGSRFWLRLPQSPDTDPATDHLPTHPIGDRQALPPLSGCCLVLDDEPLVIAAWAALLGSWGIEGRYAATAGEALRLLDGGFEPQAIFCDQRLRSGESGFDVLRALLARCPHASGAMVSGEFDSPELAQAEDEGYAVLRKPLVPQDLHVLLSGWLRTWPPTPDP
ncbi:hybrid sensor histidine kinase/response regulator [Hydrogenophaga sp. OTU3427]|uniref:hybrid sensor histidine kinase/response regulator n=1 Tax=Hydrogenophaga sp. OTU3427 TaxID=3043856 RepID=UPI00313C54EF